MKKILFFCLFTLISSIGFAQTPTEGIKVDTAVLKEYVGIYKFDKTFKQCAFEYKNGDLHVEIDSYGQYRVFGLEADKFKSTSSYGTVFTFNRNGDKKVVGVKIELMGQELEGEKQ
jgi:hypothetical protein